MNRRPCPRLALRSGHRVRRCVREHDLFGARHGGRRRGRRCRGKHRRREQRRREHRRRRDGRGHRSLSRRTPRRLSSPTRGASPAGAPDGSTCSPVDRTFTLLLPSRELSWKLCEAIRRRHVLVHDGAGDDCRGRLRRALECAPRAAPRNEDGVRRRQARRDDRVHDARRGHDLRGRLLLLRHQRHEALRDGPRRRSRGARQAREVVSAERDGAITA